MAPKNTTPGSSTYKAPGLYIEEISKLPKSVEEVALAIPAFVGYTAMATRTNLNDLQFVPTKIGSLIEYQNYFGDPRNEIISVAVSDTASGEYKIDAITPPDPTDLLYYSIRMFFDNGGHDCIIVSVGVPPASISKDQLLRGLDTLRKQDEPTLIAIPDAVRLSYSDYAQVAQAVLRHCSELKDRFAILDVWSGDRKPDESVVISRSSGQTGSVVAVNRDAWVGDLKYGAAYYPFLKTSLTYFYDLKNGSGPSNVIASYQGKTQDVCSYFEEYNKLYRLVENALTSFFITLPPSGAVAGVYATVDRDRGVWKAPANVSVNDVKEPAVSIDSKVQDSLNVDSTAGKSINVIRTFAGKGTLIWGSRTLAGNDNEWRYVPVRRFFIMVEESLKKSTAWVVFEPNDANTWVKVRGMIENYLTTKWREGALQGAKPDEAFFVKCGLGATMTALDILEGRMIVDVGLAVVRPAEFIIMRFVHKMQST